ncbi:hypothetical protein BDB00DRAFT_514263 [Zychaea mexicana]|uniref:uncharacterized protein n=1 Tax=Zychaea mexicana TaxID=64656 RepID=UPI0022FDF260|nr:uncharacterized protein BDB00DRAFT_514263 [Zychaea mexicana]KAI9491118.1 hypothetical protein BDB00DRAFT_514263 [Zychaea mexicana]
MTNQWMARSKQGSFLSFLLNQALATRTVISILPWKSKQKKHTLLYHVNAAIHATQNSTFFTQEISSDKALVSYGPGNDSPTKYEQKKEKRKEKKIRK